MGDQLTEFLAYINKYGVSKTSHFRLEVPIVIMGAEGKRFSDLNRLLGLRCEATELPGRQLVSNDSRTYGPTYKTPYQSVYQEITLNFLETSTLIIRDFFETWMSAIFEPRSNALAYPKYYRHTVTLTQYDVMLEAENDPQSDLAAVAAWNLYNAFPTAVNQMPVAWSEDGLHRTTVTLAYEWYVMGTRNAAKSAAIKSPAISPKGSAVS